MPRIFNTSLSPYTDVLVITCQDGQVRLRLCHADGLVAGVWLETKKKQTSGIHLSVKR